jgi:transaldolase
MPEATLKAFADHGEIGEMLDKSDDDCNEVLTNFSKAGVNVDTLGAQLQVEGAESFVKSWNDLLECIATKSKTLKAA